VITRYIDQALLRARYKLVDGGLYCATVSGLRAPNKVVSLSWPKMTSAPPTRPR